MNPTDFFLLLLSLLVAAASLAIGGWTFNGIGPAVLSSAGGFWQLSMQWLRHRSWLRHRESGFAPGTQCLALAAALGWFVVIVGAGIWLMAANPPRGRYISGMEARFQFSIRTILVATAAVAGAVAATNVKSGLVAVLAWGSIASFLCSLATIAATMTSGRLRAFWIGAAIPATAAVVFAVHVCSSIMVDSLSDDSLDVDMEPYFRLCLLELRAGLPIVWCVALTNGAACVFAHWLIWQKPPA